MVVAPSEIETLGVMKIANPTSLIEEQISLKNEGEDAYSMCQGCSEEKRTHLYETTMTWPRRA